jgi:hypothetical protein
MSEQPTALRLADELADYTGFTVTGMDQAAAELRRLHELNQELLESLKDAADAIEHWGAYAPDYFKTKHDLQADIDRARDIIAKAEGKV